MKLTSFTVLILSLTFSLSAAFAGEKVDPEAFTITKANKSDQKSDKKLRKNYEKKDAHESEMSRRIASYESE